VPHLELVAPMVLDYDAAINFFVDVLQFGGRRTVADQFMAAQNDR
jgi:hypothetical protein